MWGLTGDRCGLDRSSRCPWGSRVMVSVLIVEDEGLFRDMLKISLSSIPDVEVVGAVSDGQGAIDAAC